MDNIARANAERTKYRAVLVARNGRSGFCLLCPRDKDGPYPERCPFTLRADHQVQPGYQPGLESVETTQRIEEKARAAVAFVTENGADLNYAEVAKMVGEIALDHHSTFERGDIVTYWYDTGAMGCRHLYGIVVKAGPKTYTVCWESGIRNRLDQGRRDVTLLTDQEILQEMRAKLAHVASR